ncbi:MAG: RNA polymerase sigma factor [Gammaproteobacteria bacterium]|nr:RNA polymerase sigma factor [Gammaproteobacteria bacterium]MDH5730575.1 RNA polymerase sigma factor [Gammaproteobacteria bacterium]
MEQELIEQLLAGEEAAFRQIVTDYQGIMLQLARNIVGDAIADEVVQEAWVSVIKSLKKFEGRSSLKTWILTIVSNCAKTRLRKEARSVAWGDASDIEASAVSPDRFNPKGFWSNTPGHWQSASPEQLLASEQLRENLDKSLQQLPGAQRTILQLRDFEGLPMDDICKILQISESNSRVLLHRARTKLWQTIDELENS